MTCEQLIWLLKKLPKDMEVLISDDIGFVPSDTNRVAVATETRSGEQFALIYSDYSGEDYKMVRDLKEITDP